MVAGKHLSVAAPRPGQDHSEFRLEHEPDTPMHHSHRGLSSGAWRYKLVRWARLLMVFLLVVVTATWLFVDLDDLHIRSRVKGGRSERVMNELPSGFSKRNGAQESSEFAALRSSAALLDDVDFGLGGKGGQGSSLEGAEQAGRVESIDFGLGGQQEALLEDGDLGVGVVDEDYEDDNIATKGARQRWLEVLEPLTVQPLTAEPPKVDKSLPVVLLLSACCEAQPLSDASTEACHKHVMASCGATAPPSCYEVAISAAPCGTPQQGIPDPSLTFFAGLQRLAPFLRRENWTDFQVHSLPPAGTQVPQAVEEALQRAKLILADAAQIPEMLTLYKQAAFVALDGGLSATLPPSLAEVISEERVKAVWRAQTLTPSSPQNGPLLEGHSHLALLQLQYPFSNSEQAVKVSKRIPALSTSAMVKIEPLLNHAHRFRYPLDCGGDVEHLRFLGSFSQNESHWSPPRLRKRSVDVAYVARNITGRTAATGTGLVALSRHRERLASIIGSLAPSSSPASSRKVMVSEDAFPSYSAYLQQLMDIKVLVVPSTEDAEMTELDFEATLCGCLLVKVEPGLYTSHPDVFQPVNQVYGVPASWQGLQENLHMALEDMEHSQRMADRAYHLLLEHSDLTRYSSLVDSQLTMLAKSLE